MKLSSFVSAFIVAAIAKTFSAMGKYPSLISMKVPKRTASLLFALASSAKFLVAGASYPDSSSARFLRQRHHDATLKENERGFQQAALYDFVDKEDESYWYRLMQETELSMIAVPPTTKPTLLPTVKPPPAAVPTPPFIETCPEVPPEPFGSESCEEYQEGLRCDFFEFTCCGSTGPVLSCDCLEKEWSCVVASQCPEDCPPIGVPTHPPIEICPEVPPEPFGSESCEEYQEGLRCDFFEFTCCGSTGPVLSCDCLEKEWRCIVPSQCLGDCPPTAVPTPPPPIKTCPEVPPEPFGSESCEEYQEGLRCDFFEFTCCGSTGPVLSCDCLEKEWRCIVPSQCLGDCPPTAAPTVVRSRTRELKVRLYQ